MSFRGKRSDEKSCNHAKFTAYRLNKIFRRAQEIVSPLTRSK